MSRPPQVPLGGIEKTRTRGPAGPRGPQGLPGTPARPAPSAITAGFDGGGAVLTVGAQGDLLIPYNCTITEVILLADQVGSLVIDVWKDTYANYPPTVADSICGAAKPTLSGARKSSDTTLTGWTTAIAAGATLRFNIDACSTITRATLQLKVIRT